MYGRKLIAHLFETGELVGPRENPRPFADPMGLDEPEPPRGEFSDILGSDNFDEIWGG